MASKFFTEDLTLKGFASRRFIIPSYQRPYVWVDEQINKLLSDFYDAFKRGDAYYYVGTVLLNKQEEEDKTIEQLIDGQQRFTTLWLIASSFKMMESKSEITNFLKVGDELRIEFAIRKQIKGYMLSLLDRKKGDKIPITDTEIEEDQYLSNIAKAVTIINGRLSQIEDEYLDQFGDYIYEKIHFVVNTVPKYTDMRKLFTTINNTGVQLEQSDIVKSLLIKNIEKNKDFYRRIWEACENLNDYFERNAKRLFPHEFKWEEIKSYDELGEIQLPDKDKDKDKDSNDTSGDVYTIEEILKSNSMNNIIIDLKNKDIEKSFVPILKDASLADIHSVSGKLFGDWISPDGVEAEYCLLEKISNKSKKAQFQIYDDRYAKGIEIELLQNGSDIDARINWAKASRRRGENNKLLLGLDWNDINNEDVQNLDDNIPIGSHGYGIAEITINPVYYQHDNNLILGQESDDGIEYCRSIITFPQLLLHTYRIFLHNQQALDFELPFHADRLIQIFKSPIKKKNNDGIECKSLVEEDEDKIHLFFNYLWKVRWAFDQHIVKWIQKEKDTEEILSLTISQQGDFLSRERKNADAMTMLQSMCYFTGNYNTQFWLTPFLYRLLNKDDQSDKLICLEKIDNEMSLSKKTDKETSFALMDEDYRIRIEPDFKKYLGESHGTSFKHYWFQKLEYILWKELSEKVEERDNNKFKGYRITSKNSIEHVYPQNPEDGRGLEHKYLDSFGNLALLNVSQNSSYSNQSIVKKKDDFDRKNTYDSLKLKLIYEEVVWDKDAIIKHGTEMIKKIATHYNRCKYKEES